ncbi:MAG: peroxiredoxin [Pyrinomonadaceae bacterium]|jgi:peroxiredoxin
MFYSSKDKCIRPGSVAPDFELTDNTGNLWRLSDNRGNVVLLLFYPANETLVCTRQLCSLRDNWDKYRATQAEIVAISSAPSEENHRFAEKYKLPIRILSDEGRRITSLFAAHRLFPSSFMRAVTVIDANGIVRTHQSMLRAFRPDDHDILLALYAARSEVFDAKRRELRNRIRKILLS